MPLEREAPNQPLSFQELLCHSVLSNSKKEVQRPKVTAFLQPRLVVLCLGKTEGLKVNLIALKASDYIWLNDYHH